MVIQKKTNRPVQFEITKRTRISLERWIDFKGLKSDDCLFKSRLKKSPHLSTRQYAGIVERWVRCLGLDPVWYGTHTMRRTKVSLIYKRTKNLRAIQLLLGQSKRTYSYCLNSISQPAFMRTARMTASWKEKTVVLGVSRVILAPSSQRNLLTRIIYLMLNRLLTYIF